jgi:hypothetical protein
VIDLQGFQRCKVNFDRHMMCCPSLTCLDKNFNNCLPADRATSLQSPHQCVDPSPNSSLILIVVFAKCWGGVRAPAWPTPKLPLCCPCRPTARSSTHDKYTLQQIFKCDHLEPVASYIIGNQLNVLLGTRCGAKDAYYYMFSVSCGVFFLITTAIHWS